VILSSTSPHLGLERKVSGFERRGGPAAGAAARTFWTHPDSSTWAAYQAACMHLYNTKPPADALARQRTVFNEAVLFASAGGEQQTMDLLPGLANARCPVLVLAGEEDPVCPIEDARDIAAALPPEWMQFTAIPDAGHGTWRDQPEAAMARLRQFLLE
jgi:proline iminopeptidase